MERVTAQEAAEIENEVAETADAEWAAIVADDPTILDEN